MLTIRSILLAIIPSTVLAINTNPTIGVRAGIDLTALALSNDNEFASLNYFFPMADLSLDLKKPINDNYAFTLSTTYNVNYLKTDVFHYGGIGIYANYNLSKLSSIAGGINILHFMSANLTTSGNIHTLRGGISMTNYVADSIYTRFEILKSFTPKGYRTDEQIRSHNSQDISSFVNHLSYHGYAVNFSVGYDLDI